MEILVYILIAALVLQNIQKAIEIRFYTKEIQILVDKLMAKDYKDYTQSKIMETQVATELKKINNEFGGQQETYADKF